MHDLPAIVASLPPARTDRDWLSIAQTIHDLGMEDFARVQSIETIMDAHHKLQAYQQYVALAIKDRELKLQAANELNDLRIRQERWIGEWLSRIETRGGGRPKETVSAETVSPTLQEFGISRVQAHRWQTIARLSHATFESHIEERKARGDELSTSAVYEFARETEREAERESKRRAEAGPLPEDVTLWHGDFAVLGRNIPDASVDLILTDPPYGREFLPSFDALGAMAVRVLKPGGSLVLMYGQLYLWEAMGILREHLRYQWVLSHRLHGRATAQHVSRVHNHWKPFLWYVRGTYDGPYIGDVISSKEGEDGPDKRFDPWGQSVSAFALLVRRFTMPGDVILDPCCGGGTTAVASVLLRRRFIGIDVDPGDIRITAGRLAELTQREETI